MTIRCTNCKIRLIIIISLVFFISGCATIRHTLEDVEKKIADFWEKLKGEKTDEHVGTREEAAKKYEYKGLKEEIIVEPPIITPKVVKPGDIVKQELQYTLLAPQKEREFNVSETISLSSGKETFEIMERSSKKTQGIHLSTLKFTIPADLDAGIYTLITILSIGEQKKTVNGSFNLSGKQVEAKDIFAPDSGVKTSVQDAILGKWVPEIPKRRSEDLTTITALEFKRDGTVISTLIHLGKWEISQTDEIRFYITFIGKNLKAKGRIEGDNVRDLSGDILDKIILAKQKDAQLIKTTVKARVWSKYISETKPSEDAVGVELRQDGTLLYSIFLTERWEIDGKTIKTYRKSGEQGPWNYEIEKNKLLVKAIDPDISHISFVSFVKETLEAKAKGQEKILYSLYSENTKTCSLWAINPDGSEKIEILPKLPSCFVSVSPDGREIALVTGKSGKCGSPEVNRISLTNFRGEEERMLPIPKTMEVEKALWSLDGTKIVFQGKEFDSKIAACRINYWYLIDIKTGKANLMSVPMIAGSKSSPEVAWYDVDWWPDGNKVLILRGIPHQAGSGYKVPIYRLSLINQNGKEESSWEVFGGWVRSLKVSPDGTRIAFAGQHEKYGEGGKLQYAGPALFVERLQKFEKIDYTRSKPVLTYPQLSGGETFSWSFRWSPDSKKIAVSDEKSFYIVNADGTDPKRLFETTREDGIELIGWIAKFASP